MGPEATQKKNIHTQKEKKTEIDRWPETSPGRAKEELIVKERIAGAGKYIEQVEVHADCEEMDNDGKYEFQLVDDAGGVLQGEC